MDIDDFPAVERPEKIKSRYRTEKTTHDGTAEWAEIRKVIAKVDWSVEDTRT